MEKAVLYARFSSRPNAQECESITTQMSRLRAYCEASEWQIVAEKDDADKTGATTEGRPGLAEALDIACAYKATLVVYSLSRLARSTSDAIKIVERLDKCGANLVSLHEKIDTTTPMGRFVFRMIASLAELEREQIAERTSDAMLRRQGDGQAMGGVPPFGFKFVRTEGKTNRGNPKKKIVLDDYYFPVLCFIKELHELGNCPNAIARILAEDGYRPRVKKWSSVSITRIIKKLPRMMKLAETLKAGPLASQSQTAVPAGASPP
jgi:site-specific DNA recombinase